MLMWSLAILDTLPEINVELEKGPFEGVCSLHGVLYELPCWFGGVYHPEVYRR